MFVVDAFIGNWDRHNGNWGFLYNQETDKLEIAPIFDCGSSLFPQIDDELIKKVKLFIEQHKINKVSIYINICYSLLLLTILGRLIGDADI